MNIDDPSIFEPTGEPWHSACLQSHMSFAELSRYYLDSANALVDRMCAENSKLDVYVYSAVFLYRHSIELAFKESIWMSNFLLGQGKKFCVTHRLVELWRKLRDNGVALLKSDFPLCEEEIRYVEATLVEFMKCDPESVTFRYPFTKKMRPLSDVHHVNVKALYERCNKINEYSGRLSYMISCLYEEQSKSARLEADSKDVL